MATKSAKKMTDAELDAAIDRHLRETDDAMTPRFKFPKKGQARALSLTEWQSKFAYGAALFAERKARKVTQ